MGSSNPSMTETTNYDLDLYTDADRPDLTQEYFRAMVKIDGILKDNADAIDDEAERAKQAESDLGNQIAAETNRAKQAESDLGNQIAAETNRAKQAESDLGNQIAAETNRAKQAESDLGERITTEVNEESERATLAVEQLNSKIEAETTRAQNAESDISTNTKLTVDGSLAINGNKADTASLIGKTTTLKVVKGNSTNYTYTPNSINGLAYSVSTETENGVCTKTNLVALDNSTIFLKDGKLSAAGGTSQDDFDALKERVDAVITDNGSDSTLANNTVTSSTIKALNVTGSKILKSNENITQTTSINDNTEFVKRAELEVSPTDALNLYVVKTTALTIWNYIKAQIKSKLIATVAELGVVIPDGSSITVTSDGIISAKAAVESDTLRSVNDVASTYDGTAIDTLKVVGSDTSTYVNVESSLVPLVESVSGNSRVSVMPTGISKTTDGGSTSVSAIFEDDLASTSSAGLVKAYKYKGSKSYTVNAGATYATSIATHLPDTSTILGIVIDLTNPSLDNVLKVTTYPYARNSEYSIVVFLENSSSDYTVTVAAITVNVVYV